MQTGIAMGQEDNRREAIGRCRTDATYKCFSCSAIIVINYEPIKVATHRHCDCFDLVNVKVNEDVQLPQDSLQSNKGTGVTSEEKDIEALHR